MDGPINVISRFWKDGDVMDYFLISSAVWPISILAIYLSLIFVVIPKFMKNRKPLELTASMRIYNLVQVVLNSAIILYSLTYFKKYCTFCNVLSITSGHPDAILLNVDIFYYYFLLKIVDLVDTIFIALRKRTQQLSFLHMHHHVIMIYITWHFLRYNPRIAIAYMAFINSVVHVVMYFYYFLSSWKEFKKFAWVKRTITQLQIIQHYSIFIFYSTLFLKGYLFISRVNFMIFAVNISVMIGFFTNFYIRSYVIKRKAQKF